MPLHGSCGGWATPDTTTWGGRRCLRLTTGTEAWPCRFGSFRHRTTCTASRGTCSPVTFILIGFTGTGPTRRRVTRDPTSRRRRPATGTRRAPNGPPPSSRHAFPPTRSRGRLPRPTREPRRRRGLPHLNAPPAAHCPQRHAQAQGLPPLPRGKKSVAPCTGECPPAPCPQTDAPPPSHPAPCSLLHPVENWDIPHEPWVPRPHLRNTTRVGRLPPRTREGPAP
jgi:hypothetical protein